MKKILIVLFLIISLAWFWKVNKLNYGKHWDIKMNLVQHPENLPTKEFAKDTSFGFKNLRADIFWLESIQYIWWNAIKSEYKKYLYKMLDLITELNPYFEHPYKIWLLLLPSYNERYENLTEEEQQNYIKQAENLWLKWIKNFCDLDKIEKIKKEDNLNKIWTEEQYKNPCKSFSIPYYLAFVYWFYSNNPLEAANYYKVASANENSLEWAKILAAIMQGKWWNREKAFFMFLNIAKSLDNNKDSLCYNYASQLENIWSSIFSNKLKLDWKLLEAISKSRDEAIWVYTEEENSLSKDTDCNNYINKATRELNLYYIEKANIVYKNENDWTSAKNAKVLFDDWYINYLPVDYQQNKDYGIIYIYNPDTWNFDYDMGIYE